MEKMIEDYLVVKECFDKEEDYINWINDESDPLWLKVAWFCVATQQRMLTDIKLLDLLAWVYSQIPVVTNR